VDDEFLMSFTSFDSSNMWHFKQTSSGSLLGPDASSALAPNVSEPQSTSATASTCTSTLSSQPTEPQQPPMVEDIIKQHYMDYPRTHRISELVRDWVIDLDSPEMKAWFEENEWEQITSAFPTLPEQPEQLQTFLNRFSEVLLFHHYWQCSIMRLISISR
jgi:hypothetical protein